MQKRSADSLADAMSIRKPPVAGLVDGMRMAHALSDRAEKARAALRRLGYDGAHLHQCPFKLVTEVPPHLVEAALQSFSPWFNDTYDMRAQMVRLQEAPILGRWWYHLEDLDRTGRVSPKLWVLRDALPRNRPPRGLSEPIRFRFFAIDPASGLTGEPEEGVWWCLGPMLEWNTFWYWDIELARRLLARLAPKQLARELSAGKRILGASDRTQAFWEVQWVMRPIQWGPYEELTGQFPFPERAAIPFYRARDSKRAFNEIMRSYLSVSLLDDVSDKEFASQRIIARAREALGLPRRETRGRPRRRRADLVLEVGRMVEEGVPKYQVAKRLGLPRSTVYDILKAYSEGGNASGK